MSNNKIICFGAGEIAEVYFNFLNFLGYEIVCWIDNNKNKTGCKLYGKPIYEARELLNLNFRILITSVYYLEILKQLKDIGMENLLVSLETLIKESDRYNSNRRLNNNNFTLCIDAHDGTPRWAGTELWAFRLWKNLKKFKSRYLLITEGMKEKLKIDNQSIIEFSSNGGYSELIKFMETNLPIVVVQSFGKYVFFAAIYLKILYPSDVKIIGVMHNDIDANIFRQSMHEKFLDATFCVSDEVRERACRFFNNTEVASYIQCVEIPNELEKKYMPNGILRIGIASRLEKKQKRLDLIFDIIDELNKSKIKYLIEIAGDGEMYEEINDYIKKNPLANNVILLGQLSPDKMPDFWNRIDVYINISDYEGCSLAMLESMSYKCIPVVTDVSGVKDIIDENNGFICDKGDVKQIVNIIEKLSNKKALEFYGTNAYKTVAQKCNYSNYTNYWTEYIERILA